jgi:hypothetical protein
VPVLVMRTWTGAMQLGTGVCLVRGGCGSLRAARAHGSSSSSSGSHSLDHRVSQLSSPAACCVPLVSQAAAGPTQPPYSSSSDRMACLLGTAPLPVCLQRC